LAAAAFGAIPRPGLAVEAQELGAGGVAVIAVGVALWRSALPREGVEKSRRSFGLRLDYWAATWHMIADGHHPRFFWLGVAGNFSGITRATCCRRRRKKSKIAQLSLELWRRAASLPCSHL